MTLRRIIAGWSDERGAIAPFAAIVLAAVIGLTALSVDLGSWVAQRRSLQAATDAAALAAVSDTGLLAASNKDAILGNARDLLNRNGGVTPSIKPADLDLGVYCAYALDKDGHLPKPRFNTAIGYCDGVGPLKTAAVPNAVRLQASLDAPTFLSRVLQPTRASLTIKTSATAARIDEAGFYAGTGLVSIDTTQSALLNAVLGKLLGTSLNLTAVQYQGLLNANVEALGFLDALKTNLSLSAGTYDQLLATNVKVSQLLQAMVDVLDAPGSVATVALNAIKTSIVGNPSLTLGQLLDLGVWAKQPIENGTAETALQAGLNVLQLVSLSAQVANGRNAISIPSINVGLPGIASLEIASTVIEPPQSPPFTFGPVGVSVHTAQVRLQLKLQLLDLFGLLGQGVQLPLYVEAASGDAYLKAIDCGSEPKTDAMVTIAARSGLISVYIGKIDFNTMKNFDRPITTADIKPAPLLDLSLLGILGAHLDGKAFVGTPPPTNPNEPNDDDYKDLIFNQEQIAQRVSQSVASTGMVDNLLAGLEQLQLSGCGLYLLGLCAAPLDLNDKNIGKIIANLRQILNPVINGLLDPLVDGLLAALGIKLGYMDVTVTGVRCGVPVLVQ
jgi:uncharacterized membrane protein